MSLISLELCLRLFPAGLGAASVQGTKRAARATEPKIRTILKTYQELGTRRTKLCHDLGILAQYKSHLQQKETLKLISSVPDRDSNVPGITAANGKSMQVQWDVAFLGEAMRTKAA